MISRSLLLPALVLVRPGFSLARVDPVVSSILAHLLLSFPHSCLPETVGRASFEVCPPEPLSLLSHPLELISLVAPAASVAQVLHYRLRTHQDDLATRWWQQIWTRLRVDHACAVVVLDPKTRRGIVVSCYDPLAIYDVLWLTIVGCECARKWFVLLT